jgi:hypothetical protein
MAILTTRPRSCGLSRTSLSTSIPPTRGHGSTIHAVLKAPGEGRGFTPDAQDLKGSVTVRCLRGSVESDAADPTCPLALRGTRCRSRTSSPGQSHTAAGRGVCRLGAVRSLFFRAHLQICFRWLSHQGADRRSRPPRGPVVLKEEGIRRRSDKTRLLDGEMLMIRMAGQRVQKDIFASAIGAGMAPTALRYRPVVPPHRL